MKLRLSMAMVVAAFAPVAFGGCDKKEQAQAPAPAQVEAAAAQPEAQVKAEAQPTAAAPVEAKPAGEAQAAHACGGDHAHAHAAAEAKPAGEAGHACGGDHAAHAGHDHAAHAKGEADCPFDGESGAHVAAAAKPAEEAMGCGGKPLVEAAATANGGIHYGTTFSLAETTPLGKVASGAADGQELNVRVTGTIDKVCQKKGCWMVVKDGDFEARVIMKDAAFTVPLDSTGKPAQVEGTLKVRVYTEAQAKHLAEDGGQDPNAVKGEKKEFLLTATAVEIGG
jgi:hypothetical protein